MGDLLVLLLADIVLRNAEAPQTCVVTRKLWRDRGVVEKIVEQGDRQLRIGDVRLPSREHEDFSDIPVRKRLPENLRSCRPGRTGDDDFHSKRALRGESVPQRASLPDPPNVLDLAEGMGDKIAMAALPALLSDIPRRPRKPQ